MKLTYAKEMFTMNTGGNCMVDFIVLNNGKVVGINDEVVALYPSMDSFLTGEGADKIESIYL